AGFKHVPRADLLLDHGFTCFGEIEGHGVGAWRVWVTGHFTVYWRGVPTASPRPGAVPECRKSPGRPAGRLRRRAAGVGAQEQLHRRLQVRIDVETGHVAAAHHQPRMEFAPEQGEELARRAPGV